MGDTTIHILKPYLIRNLFEAIDHEINLSIRHQIISPLRL